MRTSAIRRAARRRPDDVEERLAAFDPHEIERLFFGHCRMESHRKRFDFAVDVGDTCRQKLAALAIYESVFSSDQAELLDRGRPVRRQPGERAVRGGAHGAESAAGR